jgi:hypothetical protein
MDMGRQRNWFTVAHFWPHASARSPLGKLVLKPADHSVENSPLGVVLKETVAFGAQITQSAFDRAQIVL